MSDDKPRKPKDAPERLYERPAPIKDATQRTLSLFRGAMDRKRLVLVNTKHRETGDLREFLCLVTYVEGTKDKVDTLLPLMMLLPPTEAAKYQVDADTICQINFVEDYTQEPETKVH